MVSAEDLKPVRTTEEAKERGRRGGIASGESRRRSKAMRNILREIGKIETFDDTMKTLLDSLGVGTSNEYAMAFSMIAKAVSGDTRAFDTYMKYTGQDKLREATIKQMEGETAGGGSGGDVAKLIAALNEGAAADWSGYENELEKKEEEGST